jgi:hypothetical protein
MEQAKEAVRLRLSDVKTFLARETPPRLSESDTKANFIEPIIASLGWQGIGVVTREYYVRNSQEFIDYVMAGDAGPLLALEAKPLQTDLTDKHAAQLIQYCAVEGIEWAALTNGRELQFFNTFLKPDLGAKRVLRLDLLAFNNESEFDALFGQIWQLSRESMTKPSGVRSWLNQRRLDTALRTILLDSSSATNRQLRKALSDTEISVTPQDLVTWFRVHLAPSVTTLPPSRMQEADRDPAQPNLPTATGSDQDRNRREQSRRPITPGQIAFKDTFKQIVDRRLPGTVWRPTKYYDAAESEGHTFLAVAIRRGVLVLGLTLPPDTAGNRLVDNIGEFNWPRMTKIAEVAIEQDIDDELLSLIEAARSHAASEPRRKAHYGVTLRDVVGRGFLPPGTELILIGPGHREAARARVSATGGIEWNGTAYASPSDRVFANLVGRSSLNGWTDWYAQLPRGREPLSAIRARYLDSTQSKVEDRSGLTERQALER